MFPIQRFGPKKTRDCSCEVQTWKQGIGRCNKCLLPIHMSQPAQVGPTRYQVIFLFKQTLVRSTPFNGLSDGIMFTKTLSHMALL